MGSYNLSKNNYEIKMSVHNHFQIIHIPCPGQAFLSPDTFPGELFLVNADLVFFSRHPFPPRPQVHNEHVAEALHAA